MASAAHKLVQTPATLNFIALFNEQTVSSYSGSPWVPRAGLLKSHSTRIAAYVIKSGSHEAC